MVGSISAAGFDYGINRYGYSSPLPRQNAQVRDAQRTPAPGGVMTARRLSAPESPVEPVRPVPRVNADASDPSNLALLQKYDSDPVGMAVRMRIQYAPQDARQLSEPAEADGAASGVEGVREAAEEGKCETCEKRKYQDESDDMGVSFQSPTRIDPGQAASAVRGHEMEHVVREQAKAQREDRRVVSQSVTLHTDICPECGKAYISGGTTRTVTDADSARQQNDARQKQQTPAPFSAVA